MKWKRYPAYKDSGVEWLDAIPATWEVRPLKRVASLNDDLLPENTDGQFRMLYVDISSVDERQGILHKQELVFEDAPSRARRLVRHGDVLISTVRTYLRAIAPVVNPEDNLVVSTGFAVVRPLEDQLDSSFAAYALCSQPFIESIMRHSVGVSYPAINPSTLGDLPLVLPSSGEQDRIARFLDHEIGYIDALISSKQRQLQLVEEKRIALITQAVTKGLDPNVKMKDSGVEWLGEVPEHWRVCSLRRTANRIQSGSTPPTAEERYYDEGTIPWYGPGSFDDSLVLSSPVKYISISAVQEGKARVFKKGSVMVVTIGATTGKTGYITEDSSCNQQITVVSFDERVLLGEFGRYALKHQEPILRGIAPVATLPILDQDRIAALPLVVPPVHEQESIVEFLDRETTRINDLRDKIQHSIQLLQEYRSALISAAVTGQIDVREEVV
jgi:type I restriction enzyme S subunit